MWRFGRNWNNAENRRNGNQGFTLLETMVVIAITALMAGAFSAFLRESMDAWGASCANFARAMKILALERFVRERCDETHIPYWDGGDDIAASVIFELKESRHGDYIAEVRLAYDSRHSPRGVIVDYSVDGITGEITASFASIPVMGSPQ